MLNFDLQLSTRIVFGRDTRLQIGALIRPLASRVLLHYGGGSIKRSGLYDEVTASLREAGVAYVELGGVVPNPRLSLVRQGVALCRSAGVELILAVGGGSVIDSAKAIALGLANPNVELWDIFARGVAVEKSAPVACVLTIPAAGSESSNSCVISNEETAQKYGCNLQCNRPVLSVIDPTVFFTLPSHQIANGVTDMTSHIFERYFSNTPHTELIDGLCESTLRTLLTFGPQVVADPTDYDAWCQVCISGNLAHNNLLGIGREQDWACHKMEHEVSARYDIAHGAGLAVILPQWMRACWPVNPARFVAFAVKVMGVAPQTTDAATIEAGIAALEAFYRGIGMPSRLSAFGVDAEGVAIMAKRAVTNEDGGERRVGFFTRLYETDIRTILTMAL